MNSKQIFIRTVCLFVFLTIVSRPVWAKEAIVYSHLDADGHWQIRMMAPDGSQAVSVTTTPVDKREPFLSSDGRIVYRTPNGNVFVIAKDHASENEILSQFPRVSDPQLFADGKSILFTRIDPRAKDIRDIMRSDLNGENVLIITRDNKMALQPHLSADNQKIAFVKGDEMRTSHHVWIMDVDGQNARQLTSKAGQDLFAKFSPDGKSIVYASNQDGNFEIYRVDVQTLAVKRLTQDPGSDTQPCFSPDGTSIAFVSNRGGDQQIWIMDQDGANPRPLTRDRGESVEPNWKTIEE